MGCGAVLSPAAPRHVRRQAGEAVGPQIAVAQVQCLEELLLPHRQCDEIPQFDQFRFGEVGMQLRPHGVVGEVRVPRDGLRPLQGRLLPIAENRRLAELDHLVELPLGQPCLGAQVGALTRAVATVQALGDEDPGQFLHRMVQHAFPEGLLPGGAERAEHGRHVGAHGLALQSRSAEGAGLLENGDEVRLGDILRPDIADSGHGQAFQTVFRLQNSRMPAAASSRP